MRASIGQELPDPFEDLREGLVLGGESLWKKAQKLIQGKDGREEKRIAKRLKTAKRALLLKPLWEKEPDIRWQVWVRARLGGERKVDLAREYGYRSGAAVLEVLKRLENRAGEDSEITNKMKQLKKTLRIES